MQYDVLFVAPKKRKVRTKFGWENVCFDASVLGLCDYLSWEWDIKEANID